MTPIPDSPKTQDRCALYECLLGRGETARLSFCGVGGTPLGTLSGSELAPLWLQLISSNLSCQSSMLFSIRSLHSKLQNCSCQSSSCALHPWHVLVRGLFRRNRLSSPKQSTAPMTARKPIQRRQLFQSCSTNSAYLVDGHEAHPHHPTLSQLVEFPFSVRAADRCAGLVEFESPTVALREG